MQQNVQPVPGPKRGDGNELANILAQLSRTVEQTRNEGVQTTLVAM